MGIKTMQAVRSIRNVMLAADTRPQEKVRGVCKERTKDKPEARLADAAHIAERSKRGNSRTV